MVKQLVRFGSIGWMLIVVLASACAPEESARVVELENATLDASPMSGQAGAPIALATATSAVVYVTPTIEPSPFPTINLVTETPTPTLTPSPSPTADIVAQQAQCDAVFRSTLYQCE